MIIHGVEEVSTLDKIGSIRYLFRLFVVNAKGNNFPCWGNKKKLPEATIAVRE